jgi:hypothetical protein
MLALIPRAAIVAEPERSARRTRSPYPASSCHPSPYDPITSYPPLYSAGGAASRQCRLPLTVKEEGRRDRNAGLVPSP